MRATSAAAVLCVCLGVVPAQAETRIRIMPPDGAVLAAGQRVDVRVEATADGKEPPSGLTVLVNGTDITRRNLLAAGAGGERGVGGTGTDAAVPAAQRAAHGAAEYVKFPAPRAQRIGAGHAIVIEARTADGASARVRLTVERWQSRGTAAPARNVILLLGDGMGIAHRTAARLVSRGLHNGKANGRLAMDTLEVTGLVMTPSLNSAITDSSPGMAAYSTGQKNSNNQSGVFPDNTADAFDNPRMEYIGELLTRTRGRGFNVGIVTTADVTDSTPAANAVHTSDRYAGSGIAARFFDEREANGLSVLLGGGAQAFHAKGCRGRASRRPSAARRFRTRRVQPRLPTRATSRRLTALPTPPAKILGLFAATHLPVAFDKVGAGRYSDELARPANAAYRDTPMLEDLTRLALRSLSTHSPRGFYLMVEGASIDKRAHAVDAERMIWDVIEFDRAVQVALDFARRTNTDGNPANDTLVIVAADHETGGLGIVAVGNERYAPEALGKAVRDYAAVFRFVPEQNLNFFPNYQVDEKGYPIDPDPSRKILLGWAAGTDHNENWISNRLQLEAAVGEGKPAVSVANPARDGSGETSDNRTTRGVAIPGFLVRGTIENGETPCPSAAGCPGDTASLGHTISGHTASDVPLSASGPGAWQFTGVFENSDVFLKILRATRGSYGPRAAAPSGSVPGNRESSRRP